MRGVILGAYLGQVAAGWLWAPIVSRLLGPEVMRADAGLHLAGAHPGYLRRRRPR